MSLEKTELFDLVQYVYDYLTASALIELPSNVVNELSEIYYDRGKNVRPITSTEKCIITFLRPKTAALFGDRIWSINHVPEDMSFGWNFPIEVRTHALFDLYQMNHIQQFGEAVPLPEAEGPHTKVNSFIGSYEKDLAYDYGQHFNADVLSLYDSTYRRDVQYLPGNEPAIIAIAENLAIVDEEVLSWEKVMEFRNDHEVQRAYRTFIHWLDKEMVSKPTSYISDEIACRLDRYEWALKKHGIQTVTGTIATTLDSKFLAGVGFRIHRAAIV